LGEADESERKKALAVAVTGSFPPSLGKQTPSGSYRIDLSSVHVDESMSKGPWANLTRRLHGVVELTLPACAPVRRPLPLDDLDDVIVESLRAWVGEDAARHWYALRNLKHDAGRALWKLDAHLAAIGERRDDPEARVRAAQQVERLTGLQMTVVTPNDELRLRAPLLVPIATTERNRGGYWLVDDMVLRIHPLLAEPPRPRGTRSSTPPAQSRATIRPPARSDADLVGSLEGEFPANEAQTARTTTVPSGPPAAPDPDADPTLSEKSPRT
jgi:hypothetical protein